MVGSCFHGDFMVGPWWSMVGQWFFHSEPIVDPWYLHGGPMVNPVVHDP